MGTSPVSVNVGNTGFMLLCASLVMLMTPGLAFFYGGLVGTQERARDHDAELHVAGLDDGALVRLRLLDVLRPRHPWHHRRPDDLCIPPRRDASDDVHRRTMPVSRCSSISPIR